MVPTLQIFCVSFLLRSICSLKSKSWECISGLSGKEWKGDKKCTYLRKIMLNFLKFLPYGSCFVSVQCGRLDLMDISKSMIKCWRWGCRTNTIVLIWVSVVLLFHKYLLLLRLALCTVFTLRANNDAAIVAYICYISLLRCNYYNKYLAWKEEDFCERYILLGGNWEPLSGERLVTLLKIAQLQLNSIWEAKPVPKHEFPKINQLNLVLSVLTFL